MARRHTGAPELQLIPIMNLVTLLIPFLLMSAQFVAYAVIDTSLPAICSADCGDPAADGVHVELALGAHGYQLTARGPGLDAFEDGVDIPCRMDGCAGPAIEAWDVDALRSQLTRIKDQHPEVSQILLSSDDPVPYDALILAMDAAREDPEQGGASAGSCAGRCLFPDVTLAARGAQ